MHTHMLLRINTFHCCNFLMQASTQYFLRLTGVLMLSVTLKSMGTTNKLKKEKKNKKNPKSSFEL